MAARAMRQQWQLLHEWYEMKYVKLFLSFLIAGIAFLLTGIYVNLNSIGDGSTCLGGACPGIPVSTVPTISVGGLLL